MYHTLIVSSRSLLLALWLLVTVVAATVAWQSLRFVSASTDGDQLALRPDPTVFGSDQADSTTILAETLTTVSTPSSSTVEPPQASTSLATTVMGSSPTSRTQSSLFEQTFDLVGGRTAVRFSSVEILVLWMAPADGYTADSHGEDGGMEVEFRNGARRSKLEVWWEDGPRFKIEEGDD